MYGFGVLQIIYLSYTLHMYGSRGLVTYHGILILINFSFGDNTLCVHQGCVGSGVDRVNRENPQNVLPVG